MLVPLVVVGFLAVILAAGAIVLALQNSRLKAQLDEARGAWSALRDTPRQLEAAVRDASDTRGQLAVALQEVQGARQQVEQARQHIESVASEDRKKEDWLDHQEKELEWYKREMTTRPKIVSRTYKILTLGISGTGKTALTLKWANPLVDLGTLEGTKVERYQRTVSHVKDGDVLNEHVFEVRDWGGEHIVDAQQELIVDEIHGLLLVVDLAAREGKTVEPARVQQQLREFQPESLKFFFGPKTLAACQAVVLFINKSDVLSGTPAEVEREARRHYQRLIDDLERYRSQLDVRVLVGSATYGHSTHHLFAHFVQRILPESAYDRQLLQRMKADNPPDPGTQPLLPARAPVAAPPAPAHAMARAVPPHPAPRPPGLPSPPARVPLGAPTTARPPAPQPPAPVPASYTPTEMAPDVRRR